MTRPNFLPSLPALLLLCSGTACQAQASLHPQFKEQTTKEFTLTAEAGRSTLALYNLNGSVTVQGYAGNKVLVEVTKTISADDAKTLETGKAEAQLGFTQRGDSLVVYLTGPYDSRPHNNDRRGWDRKEINYHYDFDFVVKVPHQLNVRVSTINHGDVKVRDVTGPLHVFNVNGPITLANVQGSTEARTVNGNVDASYAANPPGASSYHTINGQIRVKYPASFAADMHFKSMHGEFYTDFPDAGVLSVQVTKNREGHGGGTLYRLTKDTAVRIGKGGPDLHFEPLNGDVTVTKQ